jgi:hypothetical protein
MVAFFRLPFSCGCGTVLLHLPLGTTVGKAKGRVSHPVLCREGNHEATASQDGRVSERDEYRRSGGPWSPEAGGVIRRHPSEQVDGSVAFPLTDPPSAPRFLGRTG